MQAAAPSPAPLGPHPPPGCWLWGSLPVTLGVRPAPGWAPTAASGKAGSTCQSILGVTHHQHPREEHPPVAQQGSTPVHGLGPPGAGGHPKGTQVEKLSCWWPLLDFGIYKSATTTPKLARHGTAWHNVAWHRHGMAWYGTARRGAQLTVLWLPLLPAPTCRST